MKLLCVPALALGLAAQPSIAQNEDRSTVEMLDRTPLAKVSTSEAFKYYSGHYRVIASGNVPAMYAHGFKEKKTTVVGPGFLREYPLGELDKAVKAYRALLDLNGYSVPK